MIWTQTWSSKSSGMQQWYLYCAESWGKVLFCLCRVLQTVIQVYVFNCCCGPLGLDHAARLQNPSQTQFAKLNSWKCSDSKIPAGSTLYPILLQYSDFKTMSTVSVLAVVIDGLIQSFSKEASQVKAKCLCNAFVYSGHTETSDCLWASSPMFISVWTLWLQAVRRVRRFRELYLQLVFSLEQVKTESWEDLWAAFSVLHSQQCLINPSYVCWTLSPLSTQGFGLTCVPLCFNAPIFLRQSNRIGFTAVHTEGPDVWPVYVGWVKMFRVRAGGPRLLVLFYCTHRSKAPACKVEASWVFLCWCKWASRRGSLKGCVDVFTCVLYMFNGTYIHPWHRSHRNTGHTLA